MSVVYSRYAVIRELRHRNLVLLIGVCLDKTPIYIVSEFMAKVGIVVFLCLIRTMILQHTIGLHGGLLEITRQSGHLKTEPT